ncbi:MAG: diguanylate cyclase (GGDEF)-like protein [Paraglaciecola sp.]
MLLKFLLLLSTLSILCCPPLAHGNDRVTRWSPEYRVYLVRMSAEPDAVLQQLLAQPVAKSADKIEQAQYYHALSEAYYLLSFPKQALQHARYALSLIQDEDQPWVYHKLRLGESMALDIIGKPGDGILGASAALVWAELQGDKNLMTSALYIRGSLLNSLMDYIGALNDLQHAYELASQEDVETAKGQVAGMLALVYEYRGEDVLAIPFFMEAAVYQRQTQNWIELSIALYGLGRANKNIGEIELGRSQLEESKALAEQVKDTQGVAYALKELSGIDIIQKNFPAAQQKLLRAQEIIALSEHRYLQLDVAFGLLRLAISQGQVETANKYLQIAKGFIDPQTMPLQQISLEEEQARVSALQGNHELAFEQLERSVRAKKETYSQASTNQLHQLRSRYELEVKERENKLLGQQNQLQKANILAQEHRNVQLMMLATFAALLCLLLVILVYNTKKHRSRLEDLANTDGLTGLNNRRKTMEMLGLQIELADRHGLDLCVVMVDLDYFKSVNDRFGHGAGDKILKAFANLCKQTFRNTDIIGRIGGEEFLIGLPHTHLHMAQKILDEFRLEAQNIPGTLNIEGLSLTISCGVCQHVGQVSMEEIVGYADRALYDAKEQGRNRVNVIHVPKKNHQTAA